MSCGDSFCHELATARVGYGRPGVDGGDGDLLGGEELVCIHHVMDAGHVGRRDLRPGVASVAGEQEGRAGCEPEEVFAAFDRLDVGGDLVEGGPGDLVDGVAVVAVGAEVDAVGADGAEEQGGVGGEALEHVEAAGGEPEDGDLGAGGHGEEVALCSAQGVDDVYGRRVHGVDEQDIDGAGGGVDWKLV